MSKKAFHNINFRIRSTQNDELDKLSKEIKTNYGIFVSKTELVKLALDEFLENDDFEGILNKYRLL